MATASVAGNPPASTPPIARRMCEAVARFGRHAVFIHNGAPVVYELAPGHVASEICRLLAPADELPACYLRLASVRRCLELAREEIAARRALTARDGMMGAYALARAVLLALLLLAPLSALTVDGYVLGLSYHTDRTAGYREQNPGAGIGLSLDLGAGWEATGLALAYRDSVGNRGSAAGIGARYTVGPRDGIHATAAAVAGYLDGSGYAGPVCMPIIGTGYGPVTVEATYNPDRETAAAWLRIAWRVGK